jgi:hypothetical protein
VEDYRLVLVDGDVVDVCYHNTRSDRGCVHQVARLRVRHEHSLTRSVAHRHTKERTQARIEDYCTVTIVHVLGIEDYWLTADGTRALLAHDPPGSATLADGVSARFDAIERLFKTDGTLLHLRPLF